MYTDKEVQFLKTLKAQGVPMEQAFQRLNAVKQNQPIQQPKSEWQSPGSQFPKPWETGPNVDKAWNASPIGQMTQSIKGGTLKMAQGADRLLQAGSDIAVAGNLGVARTGGGFGNAPAATPTEIRNANPINIGKNLYQGTGDVLGGGMQAGFAPQSAILNDAPDVIKQPVNAVLGFPSSVLGTGITSLAMMHGIDTKDPNFQKDWVEPAQNMLNAFIATRVPAEKAPALIKEGYGKAQEAFKTGNEMIGKAKDQVVAALPNKQEMVPKAVDSLEQDYYKWAGQTKPGVKLINKTEARTVKLNAAGTEGLTPQRTLAEAGIIPETQGTKFSTQAQADAYRTKLKPLHDAQTNAIAAAEKITAPVKTMELRQRALDGVRTKENIASGKAAKLEAEIKKEFDTYQKEYGDELPLSVVDDIKSARWKDTKFDFSQPLKSDTNYAIAKAAQKTIETTAKKAGLKEVGQLNREIGDRLEAAKYLESLDGNTLKGGRLGKYVLSLAGSALATSRIGKIVGFMGGELVADLLMKADIATPLRRTLLKNLQETNPAGYQKVLEWMQSPEASQRLLPAPKAGSPKVQINTPIELPQRSQSTIDASEMARLQSRPKDLYNTNIKPQISNVSNIEPTIPQRTAEIKRGRTKGLVPRKTLR